MKRQVLILFALAALLAAPVDLVNAAGGGHGGGHGHGGGGRGVVGGGRVVGGRGIFKGLGHGVRTGFGHGFGQSFGGGFGPGFGLGFGFLDDGGNDLTELYRELLKNVPYFALHPPVYYSYPVPRTYGYSPFAYGPWVMTPDVTMAPEPLEIINPHVPSTKSDAPVKNDNTTAAASRQPEPLVIINPYVTSGKALARTDQ
jgi:hypothetical protein